MAGFSREAWCKGGIDLVGPVRPAGFTTGLLDKALGVAIDIMEPPEEVFPIVATLERLSVPFVFVVLDGMVDDDGPYLLTDEPGDMRMIVETLIGQQSRGLKH